MQLHYRPLYAIFILALLLALSSTSAFADTSGFAPSITINTSSNAQISNKEVYSGLKLTLLVGSLVMLPSLILSLTCFTRISIVLSLTRQALGTAQSPPNQVLLGLALFLTFSIMSPVFNEIYQNSIVPFSDDQLTIEEFFVTAFKPIRGFMLLHTREQDLELFLDVSKTEPPESPEELGPTVIVPAFIVSELNSAFQIAFLIFLPFLILDMIISSVLTSMSMITLPPTVISLPIKLMLFVMIDGWHLIIGNLVKSYGT